MNQKKTNLHVDRSNTTETGNSVLPIQLCNHLASNLRRGYDAKRAALAVALFDWNGMNVLIKRQTCQTKELWVEVTTRWLHKSKDEWDIIIYLRVELPEHDFKIVSCVLTREVA